VLFEQNICNNYATQGIKVSPLKSVSYLAVLSQTALGVKIVDAKSV